MSSDKPYSTGKTLLVDGYNMAFRAFYGMPELTRADGFPTGAIHGWVKTLWWLEDHLLPRRMIVFFDLGGADRQSALQEDYKANRKETPEALEQQMPIIKELTRALGLGGLETRGVEADDLIASSVDFFRKEGEAVCVVSADKDLGQLVSPGVSQLLPPPTAQPRLGWRELNRASVEKKFGVRPDQIADYLALVGDTSDNIPGLAGVGPKTAAKWLSQYGSLEGVIAHCGELQPKRFQALVHSESQRLRVNLQMTTLDRGCSLDFSAIDLARNADRAAEIFEEMEMGRTARQFEERRGGHRIHGLG